MARNTHDYRDCPDPACPRFPCRVYREGKGAGYMAGYLDGEVAGYAAGFSAGMASAVGAGAA